MYITNTNTNKSSNVCFDIKKITNINLIKMYKILLKMPITIIIIYELCNMCTFKISNIKLY